MQQLLIHSLLISPLVRWVAAPQRRWSRKSGMRIAVVILVVLALVQLRRVESNCFDLLEVESGASNAEIARAYRKQSALFHPDRSDEITLPHGYESKNAVFLELQECQETLADKAKKLVYDRFGRMDISLKKDSSLISIMAVFACIGYLINFVICSVFTASGESSRSRYWVYAYLLFAMSSELFLKYLGQADLFSFVPYLSSRLVFEQVEILKDLIPSVLSSAILLSQITHVDETEMVNGVLVAVSQSNREIVNHVIKKRNNQEESSTIQPAVFHLMKASQPVPAPPVEQIAPKEDSSGQAPAQPAPRSLMQTIFNYLFYAYVAKIVVDAIRSMF